MTKETWIPNYKEWIPITIKAFRLGNNMTLKDLSEKTGLSISYLSEIERGHIVPPLDTLDRILTAFDATLTLGVQDDYVPTGYIWVKRETLVKLASLVKVITPK